MRDNVGNEPARNNPDTTANEAPKGAAPKETTAAAGNPFRFTVDTTGPTLSSGRTGVFLRNPGVTSGDVDDREKEGTNNREWLRVNFSLGEGTAPLDPSTVSTTDFHVDGAEPLAVQVNAESHEDTPKGAGVYLQIGEQDTADRPQVDLVGEVRDRAGNPRTSGRIGAVTDGLAPVYDDHQIG